MPEVTLVDAINLALARALADDPDVVVFGEDVGVNGGVFRATAGLQQRFGAERVFDTPLSEALIGGLCVGMAAQSLKPVCEIQFLGFLYPCIDQLVNHASRLRNRTQGRLSCPMVLRTPHGAGIRAPEHHSEATEAMLAHIPGLRVVIPSAPERAYGLLLAAIRDPDPVVFLEPTRIYRSVKGKIEDTGEALPLDVAFVVREGRDVTLISVGGPGIVGLPDVVGRTFSTTAEVRANVLLISQSSSQNDICFIVASSDAQRTVEALRKEFAQDLAHQTVEHITVDPNIAIVAVVGENMRGTPGVAGRTFNSLGRENVNIIAIAQGSSESNISFVIEENKVKAALNTTHREFGLGNAAE